jgi:hypothetical protein
MLSGLRTGVNNPKGLLKDYSPKKERRLVTSGVLTKRYAYASLNSPSTTSPSSSGDFELPLPFPPVE